MFGLFKTEEKKLREAAKNWLYLGRKVYHFRKDELTDPEVKELGRRLQELDAAISDKQAGASKLKYAAENMESHLREVGGVFYPRGSLSENADFFFVALIIYLGVTAYFIKPFKIPTNSMWPTYYGMTDEVYQNPEDAPGLAARAARLAAFGAIRYELDAPEDGELIVPVVMTSDELAARLNGVGSWSLLKYPVSKRRFLVLPGQGVGYEFMVGEGSVELKVPQDFSGVEENILREAWFPEAASLAEALNARMRRNEVVGYRKRKVLDSYGRVVERTVALVRTGKHFRKGETILSFDILTGDQLFVDRMSYHFVKPKVGDGFVFRTENIPRLGKDAFYIKRLVGAPGDTLKIADGDLFVNGKPAEGSVVFGLNANETSPYRGYKADGGLATGYEVAVPPDSYYAMGDNSYNSLDSRYWDFVPEPEIVGRPILIYYPFTKRFGLTK